MTDTCTCPPLKALVRRSLAGEVVECPVHYPAPPPQPDPIALNDDTALLNRISAAVGVRANRKASL